MYGNRLYKTILNNEDSPDPEVGFTAQRAFASCFSFKKIRSRGFWRYLWVSKLWNNREAFTGARTQVE